ncbi:hypothetical protein RRF57_009034 [Xylaria bambusicola]|uniref:Uncharacterized protein n=1 Tax=Xylaria bambusicola TaxID=326684 RepID=A0AAN7Z187_9PEZI
MAVLELFMLRRRLGHAVFEALCSKGFGIFTGSSLLEGRKSLSIQEIVGEWLEWVGRGFCV